MKKSVVELTINGAERQMLVLPGATLVEVLREEQGLTGTRRGCDQGACGTCTVLVDGQPVMSCLIPVETIQGASVETIEGMTPVHGLHPIQEAFVEGFATQCGFCTPGMIMASVDIINRHPEGLDEATVRAELEGNICRCTGYHNIVKAVLAASKAMAKGKGKAAPKAKRAA